MGLFGFGLKKKKESQPTVTQKWLQFNKRKEERYLVKGCNTNYGEVVDIAKRGLAIRTSNNTLSLGTIVDLKLDNSSFEADVATIHTRRSAFHIHGNISKDFISKYLLLPQDISFNPKRLFKKDKILHDDDIEKNRIIINLMLEIDDPNTTIDKFREYIENLPKLKEMLLKRANSIEKARAGRIEDVKSAITRLGFEEVRSIVYDYINYNVNLDNANLVNFKDFDLYTILLNHLFKEFASLMHFNDIKSEGQSLLSMSYIGAVLISKEYPELSQYYKSTRELFSLEMRLKERIELGMDMVDICKLYFVDTLEVFHYIYDGFVLAHLLVSPSLEIGFPIMLSQRKLKFAYVAYLTILAQKFILAKDHLSGYILFTRLRRYGLNLKDAKEFLNTIIENVNKQLTKIGTTKRLLKVEYPSYSFSIDGIMGNNIYADYFKNRLIKFDEEGTRLALRFEDSYFAHKLLDALLQSENMKLRTLPYCVIPCERLADEDMSLELFNSFDLIIFKNIDKLPQELFKDFKKIWNDFEGKIILTYAKESMIDFDNEQLYEMIRNVIVDVPSYFQSPSIYLKMVQNTLLEIKRFDEKKVCNLEDFKDGVLTQKGVYLRCLG